MARPTGWLTLIALTLASAAPLLAGTGTLVLVEERGVIDSFNPPQFINGPGGQTIYIPPTPNFHRQRFGSVTTVTPQTTKTADKTYGPIPENTYIMGTDGKPRLVKEGDFLDYKGHSYKIIGEQDRKVIFKGVEDGKFYSTKPVKPPTAAADDSTKPASTTDSGAACPAGTVTPAAGGRVTFTGAGGSTLNVSGK